MKNPKLLGSAPSLERLAELIGRYFFSAVTLVPDGRDQWTVHNSKGQIAGVRVVCKRGRYRFEGDVNANN